MSSRRSVLPRRIPTQARGEKRVAAVMDAAALVIAEVGYEAATMSEIACRAGSCIGSVYQFFPNKGSLTQALRTQYAGRIRDLWEPLQEQASSLTLDALVDKLIGSMTEFVDQNPAFLQLLDAPDSTRNPSARAVFREMIARILAVKLRASWTRLMRVASVTLQLLRAMNELYAEAPKDERRQITREFRTVLGCYLSAQLKSPQMIKKDHAK